MLATALLRSSSFFFMSDVQMERRRRRTTPDKISITFSPGQGVTLVNISSSFLPVLSHLPQTVPTIATLDRSRPHLLQFEDVLVEVVLQTFVGKVDAELFEAVVLVILKTKNVQNSDGQDLKRETRAAIRASSLA